ncbi:MAG: dihydroxy-acid dehydratase, partial [Clostridiales bacterium]|nr:dihydroxy-acid dehydratase [Clostridiales bacterium]
MSKELNGKTEAATARALYKALGLNEDEITQPIIAVLSSAGSTQTAVVEAVKSGIIANGGTPVDVPLFSLCDGQSVGYEGMRYALPSRELIADAVESALIGQAFDGVALVAGEGEAAPGMLMGVARVNLPAVLIGCGYTPSGSFKGAKVGYADVCDAIGRIKNGTLSLDELSVLENLACPMFGGVNGLYAGNDFACACEALGISLCGSGTTLANSAAAIRLAKDTGKAIMNLVKNDVRPRMILTKDAFSNALALSMAIGAPADVVLHLIAVANECGIDLTLNTVQQISDRTPTLCLLQPLSAYDMQDFENAGGVSAVLNLLSSKGLIKGDCLTVTNKPLARAFRSREAVGAVIASLDDPISPHGSLAVLHGNICDEGAIVRRQSIKGVLSFSGKAKVFESEEDAILAAMSDKIHKGDAVVVRYEGPKGAPGMRDVSLFAAVLKGLDLLDDVVIITDGRFSGYAGGFTVGDVP